jgi:DNA replication protein DnaC
MDKDQLQKANDSLLAKRKKIQASSLHPPALDKAPKPPEDSEKPLPPSPADWPPPHLAPVDLGSNLARWESFDWDRHPKLRPAKRIIVDWYNGLPDSRALVLAGDVGCGKTHLADAIADLYGRWRISYYEEIELVKKIQATYSGKGGQSEESIIRNLFRADLFILDDLGTYETKNTSWLSNLYNVIFNDYLTVQSKPILITTNLPMFGEGAMAERIGARSFSRLCDALGKLEQGRYIDLFGIEDARVEGYLG